MEAEVPGGFWKYRLQLLLRENCSKISSGSNPWPTLEILLSWSVFARALLGVNLKRRPQEGGGEVRGLQMLNYLIAIKKLFLAEARAINFFLKF